MSANENAPQHGDAAGRYEHDGLGTDSTRPNTERPTAADVFAGPEDVRGNSSESPFPNRGSAKIAEESRREQQAKDARERLDKRYKGKFYALEDVLAQTDAPAAQRYAQALARKNARGGDKGFPVLVITGTDLINEKHSIPEAELRVLSPISDERVGELRTVSAAIHRAWQEDVRQRASVLHAERQADGLVLPERINLAEYTPPEVRWIAEGLWRQKSVLGLYAERKAGKSTAVREIIRALLTGEAVFGYFPVTFGPDTPIVLVDSEMPEDLLHEEYTEAGFTPEMLERLHLYSIRGMERTFDVRTAEIRKQWIARIPEGAVIIFDCLYAMLAGIGLNENDNEVAGVMLGYRALMVESGAAGAILVHHMGKDAERGARGHSSIEGSADTMAYITLSGPIHNPDSERKLSLSGRLGRHRKFTEKLLVLDEDGHLTLENPQEKKDRQRAEKRESQNDVDDRRTFGVVRAHAGLTKSGLDAHRGDIPEKRFRAALDRLLDRGIIKDRGTKSKAEIYPTTAGPSDPFGTPVSIVAEHDDAA